MPSRWPDWALVRGQERPERHQSALPFAGSLNPLWLNVHTGTGKPLLMPRDSGEQWALGSLGFDSNHDCALQAQLPSFKEAPQFDLPVSEEETSLFPLNTLTMILYVMCAPDIIALKVITRADQL